MKLEMNSPLDLHEFYRNLLISDNEELIDRLVSYSRIVELEKGTIVFHPEDTTHSSLFLLNGVLKTYIIAPDGTENTYAIYYKPGTTVVLTKDMITIPGIWCKTLTPTRVVELVGSGPYELAEEYPDLYRELLQGWMPFYFGMMDKIRAGYTLSAKERYLWFLNKYPYVADRIPQVEIANFLGIKPQSLSRIRSELAEEQEGLTPPPKF